MEKEIKITLRWLNRLKEIVIKIAENTGEERIMWIEHLKGYLSSLDRIIDETDKKPIKKQYD